MREDGRPDFDRRRCALHILTGTAYSSRRILNAMYNFSLNIMHEEISIYTPAG